MDEIDRTEHVPYARVTVAEAAAILEVNVVTVRRMIKRGQLEAERVHRPQGSAYPVTGSRHGAEDETTTEQPVQDVSRTQGTSGPAADAMVSLIQTTIGTVLGLLVGELAASRQTIERQAGQIARQAETIGELRAQNRALLASTAPEPAEDDFSRATRVPLAPAVAAVGVLDGRCAGDRAGGAVMRDGRGWRRVSLEPVLFPRPWWRRHRYWLASSTPVVGTGAIVVNMRTGEAHDWRFRGNRRGRGWFGVRTRWALFHPYWQRDPWALFYVPVDGAMSKSSTRPATPRWHAWWRW